MLKDLALILAVCLGIPLAVVGFLVALGLTLGGMATLGAIITLDLGLLVALVVIVIRHNRGN